MPLLEQTAAVGADHPGLVVEETGSPAISKGVNDQRGEDLALSGRITLLIVFGSVVMAGVLCRRFLRCPRQPPRSDCPWSLRTTCPTPGSG